MSTRLFTRSEQIIETRIGTEMFQALSLPSLYGKLFTVYTLPVSGYVTPRHSHEFFEKYAKNSLQAYAPGLGYKVKHLKPLEGITSEDFVSFYENAEANIVYVIPELHRLKFADARMSETRAIIRDTLNDSNIELTITYSTIYE